MSDATSHPRLPTCSRCLRPWDHAWYRTCDACRRRRRRTAPAAPVAPAPVQRPCLLLPVLPPLQATPLAEPVQPQRSLNLQLPDTQLAPPRPETARLPGVLPVADAVELPQLPLIESVHQAICSQCDQSWLSAAAAQQLCYQCRARAAAVRGLLSRAIPRPTLPWWDRLAAMVVTPFSQGWSRICSFCSTALLSTEEDGWCCGQGRKRLPRLPACDDLLHPFLERYLLRFHNKQMNEVRVDSKGMDFR
ncbi:uncharacterized protein NFIA_101260 [Aspergillus fischeri NRRL 181]|uniref:Uncharacterized protein n=1 Tax=Neosartorya fischeri (strain ATCC 1020 / DSM 3700 / CBS 544.65 / FGSC A1164 / JCM 1740 / NRRL 181 / WB 181) TaxID=331117 RepID=A1CVJ0_NEOFI|nr:uncharacterized protein NFIA_101260 [Aspergillus fischeri NRRL 181]EAW24642.1 hypothetical protein NFIA_101260 [Aspergillus fischeri NRRL 181]